MDGCCGCCEPGCGERQAPRAPVVGIIVGSRSDLWQCVGGLRLLKEAEKKGRVNVLPPLVSSIHRHHHQTVRSLKSTQSYLSRADYLIVGAGWAAHLPGMADSILRNEMSDTYVRVVAVAFRGEKLRKTMAAILSITEVPGNQMVFRIGTKQNIGPEGFKRAARFVIEDKGFLLPSIELKPLPKREKLSLDEAIRVGEQQLAERKMKEVK